MERSRQGLEQVRQDIATALSAQRLLHPVGFRRTVKLAAKVCLATSASCQCYIRLLPKDYLRLSLLSGCCILWASVALLTAGS